jgi:DedD protein
MRWTFWRKERPRRKDAAPSPSDERVERADPTAALRARGRRRLIGAAALLLAVVVVVPLLLDPAPRPISDNIPIEIPSDRSPFTPRLALPPAPDAGAAPIAPPPDVGDPDAASAAPAPVPAPAPPLPATAAPSPAAPATAREKPAAAKPPVEKAAPEKGTAQPKSPAASADEERARDLLEGKVAAASPGAAKPGRIQVQVAALGSETAAEELSERLRGAGFTPFTERIDTRDGLRYRVRVGPFSSRDDAERARARLRALGVGANLVVP